MKAKATLKIRCKNPVLIKKSLLPDVKKSEEMTVKLTTKSKDLIVEIESEKISYLKAAVNSYLSLVKGLKELE